MSDSPSKPAVCVILGTRPEAIKLCPIIIALQEHPSVCVRTCVTGQHREMLDPILSVFGVTPDVDLQLMERDQTLSSLTARAIQKIDAHLQEHKPGMVLVQGDTTTVLSAALCAFYHRIPVGHVEAGLRTGNKFSPYPEEINRVLTSKLADYHFAPTAMARENLLSEGVSASNVFVTGNTVIDALLFATGRLREVPVPIPDLPDHVYRDVGRKIVLITAHRRENFGDGLDAICAAITRLSIDFPSVSFVYPVHLNPRVQAPVHAALGNLSNVHLIQPLDYLGFVALMVRCTLILTDSGGIQEEAPSLGKPVLVMRDSTERPEGVAAGTARLVGTDCERIVANVAELLAEGEAYAAMSRAVNPYGDGKASKRIVDLCAGILQSQVTEA